MAGEKDDRCGCGYWQEAMGGFGNFEFGGMYAHFCPWCGDVLSSPEEPLSHGELKQLRALLDNPIKAIFSRYDITGGTNLMEIVRHEILGG